MIKIFILNAPLGTLAKGRTIELSKQLEHPLGQYSYNYIEITVIIFTFVRMRLYGRYLLGGRCLEVVVRG